MYFIQHICKVRDLRPLLQLFYHLLYSWDRPDDGCKIIAEKCSWCVKQYICCFAEKPAFFIYIFRWRNVSLTLQIKSVLSERSQNQTEYQIRINAAYKNQTEFNQTKNVLDYFEPKHIQPGSIGTHWDPVNIKLKLIISNSTKLKSMKPDSTKSYPARLKYNQSNPPQHKITQHDLMKTHLTPVQAKQPDPAQQKPLRSDFVIPHNK